MKRRSHLRETFPHHEEKEPNKQNGERALAKPDEIREQGATRQRFLREFLQAGGAEHAVVVFCDAFAAEEPGAFRTTRDGFALAMIRAALRCEKWHGIEREESIRPFRELKNIEHRTLNSKHRMGDLRHWMFDVHCPIFSVGSGGTMREVSGSVLPSFGEEREEAGATLGVSEAMVTGEIMEAAVGAGSARGGSDRRAAISSGLNCPWAEAMRGRRRSKTFRATRTREIGRGSVCTAVRIWHEHVGPRITLMIKASRASPARERQTSFPGESFARPMITNKNTVTAKTIVQTFRTAAPRTVMAWISRK